MECANPTEEARGSFWLRRPAGVATLFALSLFAAGLTQGDVRNDGALYSWVSRWMVLSGNWLDMYQDRGRTHYFNKPPLQFWIMACSIRTFGPTAASTRAVSVVFALGCALLTYRIARRRLSPEGAATVVVVLATSYTFIKNCTGCRLDAGLTFFILMTLWSALRLIERPGGGAWNWVLLGAAVGLGIMAKGGVMLTGPMIAIGTFLWLGRRDLLLSPWILASLAVCLAIAAPWHIHQYVQWGDLFLNEYFFHQVLDRFEEGGFHKSTPWYYFIQLLVSMYWPWLPLAVWGAIGLFRPSAWRECPMVRLLLLWGCIYGGAIHFVDPKYDRYLCPLMPLLAICAAWGMICLPLWDLWRRRLLPNLGWGALLVTALMEFTGVPMHRVELPEIQSMRPVINGAVRFPGDPAVVFYGPAGISSRAMLRYFTEADVIEADDEALRAVPPGKIIMVARDWRKRALELMPPNVCLLEGKRFLFYLVR